MSYLTRLQDSFATPQRIAMFEFFGSIFLSIALILTAVLMLPEYCRFFSSNELNGLACDGMRDFAAYPCPICQDKGKAVAASILLGLGVGFLILPIFINVLRERRDRPVEKTRIFPN